MRAVIYCRVSTEEEVQVNALKSQVQEAIAAVKKQNWKLVDRYVDEGKSGTTTTRRDEYNRLVTDLERDYFDIIVVKSQDRLMRNVKEWYLFVDKLVQDHKQMYFYLENKFYTPDDALLTGIKAILAEEYSRDLSKKINNAHRNRQEKGRNAIITSNTWGYDKVNKEVVVNEQEAEIVRLIFNLCCEGYGSRIIAKKMEAKGIKSRSGGKFPEVTIRRIIRNPLFMGTVLMNKRHHDFVTKETVYNKQEDWIYHEGMVPAIVSREVWERANEIMDKRVVIEKTGAFTAKQRGKNIGKNMLSGKILCGECGKVYWLRVRKATKGEQVKEWSCCEYVIRGRKTITNRSVAKERIGGCDNIHVKDNDLQDILFKVGQKVFSQDGMELMQRLATVIEKALIGFESNDIEALKRNQESIMKRRERLLDKMLDHIISDEIYKMKDEVLKYEYDAIISKLNALEQEERVRENNKKRIEEMIAEMKDINDRVLVLSRLSEHITYIKIYPNHGIISLDFMEDIRFNITRINSKTSKYTF